MTEYANDTAPQLEQAAPVVVAEPKPRNIPHMTAPTPAALQLMAQNSILGQRRRSAVVQRAVRKPKPRRSVAADSGDKPKFEIYVPAKHSYSKKELTGNDAFKYAQQQNSTFVSNNMPRGYALKLDHKNKTWHLVGPLGVTLEEARAVLKDFRFKGKVLLRGGPKPRPVDPEPVKPDDPGPVIPDPVIPDPVIPDPVIPDPVPETESTDTGSSGFAPKISSKYLDNEGNVTRTDDADQTFTALGKVKRVEFDQLSESQRQAAGNASTLRERVNSLEAAAAMDTSVARKLYGVPAKVAAAATGEMLAQGTIDWSRELAAGDSALMVLRGLLQEAGLGKEDFPKLLDNKNSLEDNETDELSVPDKAAARERLQPNSAAARQLRQALGHARAGEIWSGLRGYSNGYLGLAGSILKSEALPRRNTSASSLKPSLVKTASNGGVAINGSALSVSWLSDKAHKDFWSGKVDALS